MNEGAGGGEKGSAPCVMALSEAYQEERPNVEADDPATGVVRRRW